MLACQEEVMVLVKQGPMEGDQGLPLFVGELVGGRGLLLVDLHALLLDHHQASIDAWGRRVNQIAEVGVDRKQGRNIPLTSFTNCSWVMGRVSDWRTMPSCSIYASTGDDGGEPAVRGDRSWRGP